MAPAEPNIDYYAVLEISNTATLDLVTKSYRRLAKIRHPDKNLNGDSTALFQLLQNAYDTISDPSKRRDYDRQWPSIRDSLQAQQESEKRQAEAARAEREQTAEARAKRQQEDRARQERLQKLEQSRCRYNVDVFELSRAIRKLVADLKRLQEQDDEEVRREKERNGWWAYLTGHAKETDEQKCERDKKHHDRQACARIKGSALAEKEARLRKLQDALRDVDGRIAAEKQKAEEERKRVEGEARARKMKTEREAWERAMREAREQRAKAQRERDERAAREAREADEAWEKQERERERAKVAAEKWRKEVEERVQEARRAKEEAAAAARKGRSGESGPKKSTCRHEGWWPKVEGRQLCSECGAFQNRFALQCPGCKIVACASCQKGLRGGRWKGGGDDGARAGRRYGSASVHDIDFDNPYYDYD